MKHARVIGALVAVAVLGGGIIGFLIWRGGVEREDTARALLRAVESELSTETIDRDSIRRVLRQVRNLRGRADQAGLPRPFSANRPAC